jgi:signal transduction histidine kinase
MMSWRELFKKSEINEEIIKNEILDRNIQYISILSYFAVPVNIFHIFTFYLNLNMGNEIEYKWRMGIIIAHSILLIFFSFIGIFFNYYKRKKNIRKEIIQLFFYMSFTLLIAVGVAIVIIDQLVTSAITPYLFTCIAIPLIFLIRPLGSVLILISSYILFYSFLSLTQSNPQILLSNRVNGFSFAGIGIFLSFIMWSNSLRRYQQDRIIKQQNINLEKNYKSLMESTEKLQIANATKDKFFGIIAHDLRNPLGSFKEMTRLLHEDYNDFTEQDRIEILESMKESSNRIYLLLEILLEWSRSQKGEIPFDPMEINLFILAENTIQLLKATADSKKILLLNSIKKSTIVNADMNMLNTIIRNLISNAIKFTRESGSIIINSTESNEQLTVSVADTGIGMSQKTIDSLFRIDVSTTTLGTNRETGTGLGLILCKEFVKKHGGTIEVTSELGKGSTFTFTLPKGKVG